MAEGRYVVNSSDCAITIPAGTCQVTLEPITIYPVRLIARKLFTSIAAAEQLAEERDYALYVVPEGDPVLDSYTLSENL